MKTTLLKMIRKRYKFVYSATLDRDGFRVMDTETKKFDYYYTITSFVIEAYKDLCKKSFCAPFAGHEQIAVTRNKRERGENMQSYYKAIEVNKLREKWNKAAAK